MKMNTIDKIKYTFNVDEFFVNVFFHCSRHEEYSFIDSFDYKNNNGYIDEKLKKYRERFKKLYTNCFYKDCIVYTLNWLFNDKIFSTIFYVDQVYMSPDKGMLFEAGDTKRKDIIRPFSNNKNSFLIV